MVSFTPAKTGFCRGKPLFISFVKAICQLASCALEPQKTKPPSLMVPLGAIKASWPRVPSKKRRETITICFFAGKLIFLTTYRKSLKKRRSVINTVGIIRYGALRDRNRYEERVNKTKPTVVPKTNFSQELVFSMRFKKNVPGTVKQTSEAIKKDNNCRKKYVVGTF